MPIFDSIGSSRRRASTRKPCRGSVNERSTDAALVVYRSVEAIPVCHESTTSEPKERCDEALFLAGACSLSRAYRAARDRREIRSRNRSTTREKKTKSGVDYWSVNGKGQVPVLEFDNGERLTEGTVIVQWIADQNPSAGLIPAAGKPERYRVQEWLNFTTSELHKGFAPIFRPTTPDAFKDISGKISASDSNGSTSSWPASSTDGRHVHRGRRVSVHRAALVGPREARLESVQERHGLYARVEARPKVQEALKAEGLIQLARTSTARFPHTLALTTAGMTSWRVLRPCRRQQAHGSSRC